MAVKIHQLRQWKQQGRPISVLTTWDYAFATILDQAGIDVFAGG